MKFDITILTDRRYINPKDINPYIQNVLDEDQLLKRACEDLGLKMHRTNWDDPDFEWSSTKYVIFRTTWDYFDRFAEFSEWLNDVSSKTILINSKNLIYWNLDKKYLLELSDKGVSIPPTIYVNQGEQRSLSAIANDTNWKKFILKPAISGAARHTYKIEREQLEAFENLFADLIANENMMLQEYQEQIASKGEVSFMLFGGKYSHAVLKQAKPGDFRVQDDFGGSIEKYEPNKAEIQFAENALSKCPELPVYARVDVFWDNDDQLVLGELELIEPELWFRMHVDSAKQCAEVLSELVG